MIIDINQLVLKTKLITQMLTQGLHAIAFGGVVSCGYESDIVFFDNRWDFLGYFASDNVILTSPRQTSVSPMGLGFFYAKTLCKLDVVAHCCVCIQANINFFESVN